MRWVRFSSQWYTIYWTLFERSFSLIALLFVKMNVSCCALNVSNGGKWTGGKLTAPEASAAVVEFMLTSLSDATFKSERFMGVTTAVGSREVPDVESRVTWSAGTRRSTKRELCNSQLDAGEWFTVRLQLATSSFPVPVLSLSESVALRDSFRHLVTLPIYSDARK